MKTYNMLKAKRNKIFSVARFETWKTDENQVDLLETFAERIRSCEASGQ